MNKSNALLSVRVLSVLAFIVMLTVNALASILPINGMNTGQISDLYPSLFTPAGLTFSIWGVIYAFLLLYTVYQTGLIGKKSQNLEKIVLDIGGLYILTCLANTAWILCWQYKFMVGSVVVMLILLTLLILIYLKLKTSIKGGRTSGEKWCLSVPFSLYLAWISVATIANITALLVKIKWDGWGIDPQIWTIAVIVVAILITLLVLKKHRDVAYSLVVMWALIGILIQHTGLFKMQYIGVILVVILGLIALLIGIYFSVLGKKKVSRKNNPMKPVRRKKRK